MVTPCQYGQHDIRFLPSAAAIHHLLYYTPLQITSPDTRYCFLKSFPRRAVDYVIIIYTIQHMHSNGAMLMAVDWIPQRTPLVAAIRLFYYSYPSTSSASTYLCLIPFHHHPPTLLIRVALSRCQVCHKLWGERTWTTVAAAAAALANCESCERPKESYKGLYV